MEVCSTVLHSASAVGNVCTVYTVFADNIVSTKVALVVITV